ncbi:MAG: GntR family transcriptional regulator [Chloroflexi bacterium]|nr:GntR family transcriptional regulator [Chloroflexota bacterium]
MTQRPKNKVLQETASIDRDSFEPAYAQLANILRQSMAEGLLRPGDQLPSEAQLVKRYGVSPMTVRRSINILVDQGVVIAEQGRGTFVKPVAMKAATFHLGQLENLFGGATVQLLEARIVAADERVARKLAIKEGKRTIYIRRLLWNNDEPAFYHREYLIYDPTRPIVEAELEVTALQQLFSGSSESLLKHGEINIESTLLDEEEACLLKTPQPMAAFCFEHLFYDFDNHPVSWGWFIGRADRMRFTTQVGLLLD